MKVIINKDGFKAIGEQLEAIGVDMQYGRTTRIIDLSEMGKDRVEKLRAILAKSTGYKFTSQLKCIDDWNDIVKGGDAKCRNIAGFAGMLKGFFGTMKRKWIYVQDQRLGWLQPYHIHKIEYVPASNRHGYREAAHVIVSIVYSKFGYRDSDTITFFAIDCVGFTVMQSLAKKDIRIDCKDLYSVYSKTLEKYNEYFNKVGMQFTAIGFGHNKRTAYLLDKEGIPAKVVVDVPFEEGDEAEKRDDKIDEGFWDGYEKSQREKKKKTDEDDEDFEDDDDVDQSAEESRLYNRDINKGSVIDIPVCPAIRVFELQRQYSCEVNVNQLTKYIYNKQIEKRLVLPPVTARFIHAITTKTGRFQDIVEGKSGGQIILCVGPPGCGKTLTAEVFSEGQERPLYTVQCSQLGLNAKSLEEELDIVFRRAIRWNAILLLDEADVYIMKRGNDLAQNAIVGVFLRVLEYYRGVMFMTTNRGDCVDDAIASRCMARIDYEIPDRDGLRKIWNTLAETSGVAFGLRELEKILDKFPGISGRDVKNLLKLALMMTPNNVINLEDIENAEPFKPVKKETHEEDDAS